MAQSTPSRRGVPLQARVTCPHCWHPFPPQDALWISEHPELRGDSRLGTDSQLRFSPTRFDVAGAALDAREFPCHELACPGCHLPIPRAMFEFEPFFASIFGSPSCGKSYMLASMTWRLREAMPRHFGFAFNDADPAMNQVLTDYEEQQFLNADQTALVALRKTEEQGDLYNTVLLGDDTIRYPQPFLFTLKPMDSHPNYGLADKISKTLCLYDNAGESFLPGADRATAPVTRHLATSRVLFFLFDPTQDPRFRKACAGRTADPQMVDRSTRLARERPVRQETVLIEAAARVRRQLGLANNRRHARPLVVVVTKYDAWNALLGGAALPPAYRKSEGQSIAALDLELVEKWSLKVRELLWQHTPELVSAAEGFAAQVIYIPISALGRSPEQDAATGALGIRPQDVAPQWPEVPMLYALARYTKGLIPYAVRATPAASGNHSRWRQSEEPAA